MSKTKLTKLMKATIVHAAARSAYYAVVDAQEAEGARASGCFLCHHPGDEDGAQFMREKAETAYSRELDILNDIQSRYDVEERLRRHVIRTLIDSPRLYSLACRYLRDIAAPIVRGLDPREGGTLLIHAFGLDWRDQPAIRLTV